MNKLLIIALTIIVLAACNNTQKINPKTAEKASKYFNEVATISEKDNGNLWGFKLQAPMLLIDTINRTVYASEEGKGLKIYSEIFAGTLPEEIQINNSTIAWNGKRWIIFKLPINEDKNTRQEKFIRELFLYHSTNIGLDLIPIEKCSHFSKDNTKLWLKIEIEALKSALQSKDKTQKEHIRLALAARKLRKMYASNLFTCENNLDLKIGLSKFTGLFLSDRKLSNKSSYLYDKLEILQQSATPEDSFYNVLFPTYGLLMSQQDTDWVKEIKYSTNLSNFITTYYGFKYPEGFSEMMILLKNSYRAKDFENENLLQ